jgi:hypothetical protein
MEYVINQTNFSFSPVSRFWDMVENFKTARARRLAFEQAYAELQLLSDRELMEFGLHRSDLCDLAWVAVYKD